MIVDIEDSSKIELYEKAYAQIVKKQKILFYSLLALLLIILFHVFQRPSYEYRDNISSGEIKSIISREMFHFYILNKLNLYESRQGYTVRPVSANYYHESIYHAIEGDIANLEDVILEKINGNKGSTSFKSSRSHVHDDEDFELFLNNIRNFFGLVANWDIKYRYFHEYEELKRTLEKTNIKNDEKNRVFIRRYAKIFGYFSYKPRELNDKEYIYLNYILPRKLFCKFMRSDCDKWAAWNFALDYDYSKDFEVLKRIINNDEHLKIHTSIILEDDKGYSIEGMPIKLKRNWIVYIFPIILGFFSIRIIFYERLIFKISFILKQFEKYSSNEALLLIEGTSSSINASFSILGRYFYLAVRLLWWLLIVTLPIVFFIVPILEWFFSSFAYDNHATNQHSVSLLLSYILSIAYILLTLIYLLWKFLRNRRSHIKIVNVITKVIGQMFRFIKYLKSLFNKWSSNNTTR